MLNLIVGFAFLGLAKGGISIPREECTWVGAHHGDWGKCDGDMVAVGACGSGGDQDCPGGFSTGLKCCRFEGFYYGHCEMAISDDWGDNFECSSRVDGQASLVEAICGSGHDKDCEGHSHKAECCEGHVEDVDQAANMTVRVGLPMGSTAVNLFYFSDLKIYIVLKVNCNHIFKWVLGS